MIEKKIENVSELDTREEYDNAMSYVMQLINEATANGLLSCPEADNEYVREIGRVGHLCAVYEDTKIEFKHLKVKKKSPLIRSIEDEMYSRDIKQKELAGMLGINEPALSQIMRGKRPVSMRMAKRLHKSLNIDAKMLIEYA
jgi:antitoxin component HigA of HigAB toxin-antitoxin module